jgi:hypothetical protein
MTENCSGCVYLRFVKEKESTTGIDMRKNDKCQWGLNNQGDCPYYATRDSLIKSRDINNEINGKDNLQEEDFVTPKRLRRYRQESRQ